MWWIFFVPPGISFVLCLFFGFREKTHGIGMVVSVFPKANSKKFSIRPLSSIFVPIWILFHVFYNFFFQFLIFFFRILFVKNTVTLTLQVNTAKIIFRSGAP